MTFEHADQWDLGDNYFFFDTTHPDTEETKIYGEYSPSISFGKILKKDLSFGLVKDYRLTATIEMGNGSRTLLYGIGFDLNFPVFNFFKVNIYVRDNPAFDGKSAQLTLTWLLPIKYKFHRFQFTGFSDFSSAEANYEMNQLIVPQFLWDLGSYRDSPGNFLTGIEYSYWHNKFGIKNINESVIQYMLKVIF